MKILYTALLLTFLGCKDKSAEGDKTQNQTGVPNVNGNIPDTTNAINLSTQKKDTVQAPDSLQKK